MPEHLQRFSALPHFLHSSALPMFPHLQSPMPHFGHFSDLASKSVRSLRIHGGLFPLPSPLALCEAVELEPPSLWEAVVLSSLPIEEALEPLPLMLMLPLLIS